MKKVHVLSADDGNLYGRQQRRRRERARYRAQATQTDSGTTSNSPTCTFNAN